MPVVDCYVRWLAVPPATLFTDNPVCGRGLFGIRCFDGGFTFTSHLETVSDAT